MSANPAVPATTDQEGVEAPAPSKWVIFAVVGLALLMSSIDQTIVSTALPTLHHALHASINWASWTISGYSVGLVLAMPLAGKMSEHFGHRRFFLACAVLFTTSSFLCGIAPDIYVLVGLRVVQAIGGGGFVPSATGIVADHFGRDRDRGVGLFTSIYPIGSMIGPVVGGILITDSSWRLVFFINVPIGALLVALGLKVLPRSRRQETKLPNFVGVLLLSGCIVSGTYGVSSLGSGGVTFTSPIFLAPELTSLVLGYAFVRQVRSSSNPVIPLQLLRQRAFATMNVIALIYGAAAVGFASLVPLYAEERYGVHPLQAGTLLTARAVGSIAVAGTTAMVLRHIGYRLPMVLGFGLVALGLTMMAVHPRGGLDVYSWLALWAAVMGIGGGMAAPATNNAVLSMAPGQAGSISGLRSTFRQVGGMIAISVVTAAAARSAHPGTTIGHSLFVFALVLIAVSVPLSLSVKSQRGTW